MGKYREVRELMINILSDKQWHKIDEIQHKCEEEGINLTDKTPIYNVAYQLRKKGKIEANGAGEYRMYEQDTKYSKEKIPESSNSQKNQLIESVENIEMYLDKYKKFDWINCTDEELRDARSNVAKMFGLAEKVKEEFRKI